MSEIKTKEVSIAFRRSVRSPRDLKPYRCPNCGFERNTLLSPKCPPCSVVEASLQGLVRKCRHKWFAHTSREAENGWSGPHDHIEDAARAALLAWEAEGDTCWIAQGRKLTKAEYEEQGAEYTWEVDTLNAIKLALPNEI